MGEQRETDHHLVSHDRYEELKEAYNRRARRRAAAMVDYAPDGRPIPRSTRIHGDDDSD
ncbi:hypothetical protein [Agromyces larvae]|uniref:Uncharacterized protein n=1 Tax=Agromyces larvae TaxID=2929802 RepID=A0ABY4BZ54_9MICO|nr:hypothetical protein [Agromyces larvae]UOE44184.1 hypothetical protein MTO99_18830 [Agromyces larvae]